MTIYQIYVAKLRNVSYQLQLAALAFTQAPLVKEERDIDERIKAANSIIEYTQEAKRYLLYFKNKLRDPNTEPPKAR